MAARAMLITVCGLALASTAQADGKLDRARDQIRHGSDDDEDSDEDDDGSWVAELIGGFVHALFAGDDDDDDDEEHGVTVVAPHPEPPALEPDFGYSSYPYERRDAAYLVEIDRTLAYAPVGPRSDVEPAIVPAYAQPLAGQIGLEGGHWDGVTRSGLSARFLTDTRFELDGRVLWLHEPASDSADALLGDAHVGIRFAQTDALLLRLGLGTRFWSDREIEDIGIDALLGLDLFPARPFVVSAQIGGGNLGQAPVGSARIQVGVALQRLELLAGAEWLRIGAVDLSTPVLGLRLWL